jgi:hypothetical protein
VGRRARTDRNRRLRLSAQPQVGEPRSARGEIDAQAPALHGQMLQRARGADAHGEGGARRPGEDRAVRALQGHRLRELELLLVDPRAEGDGGAGPGELERVLNVREGSLAGAVPAKGRSGLDLDGRCSEQQHQQRKRGHGRL